MSDDHKFHKHLAYSQIGISLVIGVGSILIGMGVALVTFAFGIDLDALDKKGDTYQVFYQITNLATSRGYDLIIAGIIIMVGGIIFFTIIVRKLK